MSSTSVAQVVRELRGRTDPRKVEGMARFGINPRRTLGVSVKDLRQIAKRLGDNTRSRRCSGPLSFTRPGYLRR